MSHDLVSLGIASQNLTPNNPSFDSRPLFQAALNYVQNHPVQTLTLDTGAYYLLTNTQGNAVLMFPNLSNPTIDLAGSTIYFNNPQLPNGLQLFYCSNVTLTNFQIDFVNPPYTHVQLVSFDSVNRLLNYQTLAGWPDPISLYNQSDQSLVEAYWAAFFRNGSIVPGTTRTLLQPPFTNTTITVPATDPNEDPCAQCEDLTTLQAGDTVVVIARRRRAADPGLGGKWDHSVQHRHLRRSRGIRSALPNQQQHGRHCANHAEAGARPNRFRRR